MTLLSPPPTGSFSVPPPPNPPLRSPARSYALRLLGLLRVSYASETLWKAFVASFEWCGNLLCGVTRGGRGRAGFEAREQRRADEKPVLCARATGAERVAT